MATKHFKAGEVIFHEGEQSNEAYFLVLGSVEISLNSPEGPHVLGQIGAGEIFGEMGLITDRPRSATATAIEATTVESIDEGIFEQSILRHPERLHAYLSTLFHRIRTTDVLLQREIARRSDGSADAKKTAAAMLSTPGGKKRGGAAMPLAKPLILRAASTYHGHPDPVEITKLPFRMGRAFAESGVALFARNDLSIPDEQPYQVSRNHCEIDRDENGALIVRDRGSTLGTVVNGATIGLNESAMVAALKNGENVLILGVAEGPHHFTLTVS